MENKVPKKIRQFWLTQDLMEEVEKIRRDYNDERLSLSIRRLLREALAHRARAEIEKPTRVETENG